MLRSWLFVPGDSERKQEKALASAADALILDLEDSVAPPQLPAARQRVGELLRAHRAGSGPQLWVRSNPPSSPLMPEDLAAIFAHGVPQGIVLPKVSVTAEIVRVARLLSTLEARLGAEPGSTRLLIIATETPAGLLALPQYPAAIDAVPKLRRRIAGITWGAEDLSTALGALAQRENSGALTFTFQLARTQCLLAAAAVGAQAIDGVCTEFRDTSFAPTEAEREHARRVVAAFASAPSAGVVSLDGRMIDRPHLLQAQRVLAAAQRDRDGT